MQNSELVGTSTQDVLCPTIPQARQPHRGSSASLAPAPATRNQQISATPSLPEVQWALYSSFLEAVLQSCHWLTIQQALPAPLSSHFKTKHGVDGQGQMSHHSSSIRKQMSHNEREFSERGAFSFTKRPQGAPAEAVLASCHWTFLGEDDDSWSGQDTARTAHRQAAVPGDVTATALWVEAEWYEILTVISLRKNVSQLLILLPSLKRWPLSSPQL